MQSVQNSVLRLGENWRFGARVRDTVVPPPLFLLGHWRQGTTHLHNLFATDDRFAFPNTYQALYPHTFLSTTHASGTTPPPAAGLPPPPRPPT